MSNPFATAGVNYANPVIAGGTGTLAKIFPAPSLNFNVASTVPAALLIQAQQQGQIVSVKAAGNVFLHGASPTVNFEIQNGTSLTAASNSTIATMNAAQSLTTGATYPFAITLDLQGDQTSGIVQVVNASIVCDGVSGTVTKSTLTGINWTGANQFYSNGAPLSLVVGVTFAVSDALNTASLFQFEAA